MRSALICVLFSLTAIRCWSITVPVGNYRPTPIPLQWHRFVASDSRPNRALDTFPDTTPVANVRIPPHYWEDALRHSIYLTLVRDNIDKLISEGDLASPGHPDQPLPRDLEDKDLWRKIKSATFDRVPSEENTSFGDVTLMSSGKLLEYDGIYRLLENEKDAPDCEGCTDDNARALWSVKRMRQRENDVPGRYRYELTFSVVTDASKSNRRPHENPARTFTVKESSPEIVNDEPQENRAARKQRGERALWLHKNIYDRDEWEPLTPHSEVEPRHYTGESPRETQRMFTSLFVDDEKPRSHYAYSELDDAQRKYVNIRGPPQQHSKLKKPLIDHQQKKLTPYPYKSHNQQKYLRPLPMPISHAQHHYLDIEQIGVVSSPYAPQKHDHRHIQQIPPKQKYPPPQPQELYSGKNFTEQPHFYHNTSKVIPKPIDPIVEPTKSMPTSIRIGYVTEHIRPPVYNTPPGVFVTMDKKPFKPLPPMKLHHATRPLRPADFRPSPQVLDIQFSEPDPLFEAFRPINVNYTRINENSTEGHVAESTKHVEKVFDGKNTTEIVLTTSSAPSRRNNRITTTTTSTSTTSTTTNTPEPSTSPYEDIESMSWTNLLGAFTGTTPSDASKPTSKTQELKIEAALNTNTNSSSSPKEEEEPIITSTSTTVRPTRPPYKHKVVNVKKHKRVTSTTTTASKEVEDRPTTTEHTVIPFKSTETILRTTTPDSHKLITEAAKIAPITELEQKITESQKTKTDKPRNRYRMSTLMIKGTSLKHDKWNSQSMQSEQKPHNIVKAAPILGKYSSRRTESNFQGYLSSSTTESGNVDRPYYDENDRIVIISSEAPTLKSTTESTLIDESITFEGTKDQEKQIEEQPSDTYTLASDLSEQPFHKQKQKTKQKLETLHRPRPSNIFSVKTNDRMNIDEPTTTQFTSVASPHNKFKNGTKCKKKNGKKPTADKTTETIQTTETITAEPVVESNIKTVTPDILEELFGFESEINNPSSTSELEKDKDYSQKDNDDSDILEDLFGIGSDSTSPTSSDEPEIREERKQRDNIDHDFDYSESAPDVVLNNMEEATTTSSNLAHDGLLNEGQSEASYSLFELIAME